MEDINFIHNQFKLQIITETINKIKNINQSLPIIILDFGILNSINIYKFNKLNIDHIIIVDNTNIIEQIKEYNLDYKVTFYNIENFLSNINVINKLSVNIINIFFTIHSLLININNFFSKLQLNENIIVNILFLNIKQYIINLSNDFENDYIYIKLLNNDFINIKYKYQNNSIETQKLLNSVNIIKEFKIFFNTHKLKSFLSLHNNINNINDDIIIFDLMNSFIQFYNVN